MDDIQAAKNKIVNPHFEIPEQKEDGNNILDTLDQNKIIAKTRNIQNRNQSEILLGATKAGGDSKYMQRVKNAVRDVEDALRTVNEAMTEEALNRIETAYSEALKACRSYDENQGHKNRIAAWQDRKTMVRDIYRMLGEEYRLIVVGASLLKDQKDGFSLARSGAELLEAARVYKLGNKMLEKKRTAPPPGPKPVRIPLEQAKQEVSEKNVPDAVKDMMALFKTKKIRPSALLSYKTNTPSGCSEKEKAILKHMKYIRQKLYQCKPQDTEAFILDLEGTEALLIHKEDHSLEIRFKDETIELGNTEQVLRDMEDDILRYAGKYYDDDDLMDAVNVCANLTVETAQPYELVRGRRFMTKLLSLRSGILQPEFKNLSFYELVRLSGRLLNGKLTQGELKRHVSKANRQRLDTLNCVAELELTRANHVVSYVDYNVRYEDRQIGWTDGEKKVLNLIADLGYTEDTIKEDMLRGGENSLDSGGELTEAAKAAKIKRVLLANTGALVSLITDNYQKKIVNEQKKEGQPHEPTMVDKLLDKLPVFLMGGGAVDETKRQLNGIISGIVNGIIQDIEKSDMNFIMKGFAKGALATGMGLEGRLVEKLEGLSEDDPQFKGLADMFDHLNSLMDTMEQSVGGLMKECTDKLFTDQKEQEEGAAAEDAKPEDAVLLSNETERQKAEREKAESDARIRKIQDRMRQRKETYETEKSEFEGFLSKLKEGTLSNDEHSRMLDLEKWIVKRKDRESKELGSVMNEVSTGRKGQGAYLKNVLRSYFDGLSKLDRRAMIASAIRNARPISQKDANENEKDNIKIYGEYLGGLFMGAGPLFQKLLQGLPVGAVPDELKKVIDDMKDSLSPIPERIVKQKLNAIVAGSDKIDRIDVRQSLGAASVGQAFLCTIYGSEYAQGKDVVIKILRPEVKNRMARERAIMENAAMQVDWENAGGKGPMTEKIRGGMYNTFMGTYKRIEEELDLTIEANNIEAGQIYYNSSDNSKYVKKKLKVVKVDKDIEADTDVLVLEKADGITAKRYMNDTREEMMSFIKPFYKTIESEDGREEFSYKEEDGEKTLIKKKYYELSDYSALIDAKDRLDELIKKTKARQKYLLELSDTWSREGVFRSGFYHGDLHAGNIMLDDNGATIIDFGNVTQLSERQLGDVTRMMLSAGKGDVDVFLDAYHNLLENTPEERWKRYEEELKAIFTEVLSLGAEKDAGLRISVALLRAQEVGFELPASIANFANCQLRLQNTVDDMNRLLKDLKQVRTDLDNIESGRGNYQKASSIAQFAHDTRLVGSDKVLLSQMLSDQRELRGDLSEEERRSKFHDVLNDKKNRSSFLRSQAAPFSIRGEVMYIDYMFKNYKTIGKDELLAFVNRSTLQEAAPRLYVKILDRIIELRKKKRYRPRDEAAKLQEKIRSLSAFAGSKFRDIMLEIADESYKGKGFFELLNEEGLMDLIPEESEYEKGVREYFDARDKRTSQERLLPLENALWEKRKLIDISGDIKEEQESVLREMMTPVHVDEEISRDLFASMNTRKINLVNQLVKPCLTDSVWGPALNEAMNRFKEAYLEYALKEDESIGEREKLEPLIDDVIDLYWNAQKNLLKDLQDKLLSRKDIPGADYNINKEEDTFFDVIGDVIKRNKLSALGRYGYIKSAGMMFSFVLDKIKVR